MIYMQFPNGVIDRETLTFVDDTPDIRVTNLTGWAWEGSGPDRSTEEALAAALERVAAVAGLCVAGEVEAL